MNAKNCTDIKAKSQHYNPQCYLRGFQQKKRLWQYDLLEGVAIESTAKKSGCADYYHAVDLEDGSRDDETLEKLFHPLENDLPKLFEAVRWGRSLSPEIWDIFSHSSPYRMRVARRGFSASTIFWGQFISRLFNSFATAPK